MIKAGIAFWGTKRGHQIFFTSDNINKNDIEIKDALKDIRPVLRYNKPGREFYGLEYTQNYTVYTIYRSIYDWSNSPGYFAVTLFVPHSTRFDFNIVATLQEYKNKYLERYVDDRYRIINKIEDKNQLLENLDNIDVNYNKPYSESLKNNNFALIFFSCQVDLEQFFSSPYRVEFKKFQEVLFVPKELETIKDYSNFTLLDVDPIEEKYSMDIKVIVDGNICYDARKNISINGTNETDLNNLSLSDSFSSVISGNYFDEIVIPPEPTKSITIKQLLELKAAWLDVLKFNSKISLTITPEPKNFTFKIILPDINKVDVKPTVLINQNLKPSKIKGNEFLFNNVKLQKSPKLSVTAAGYKSILLKDIKYSDLISGVVSIPLKKLSVNSQNNQEFTQKTKRKRNSSWKRIGFVSFILTSLILISFAFKSIFFPEDIDEFDTISMKEGNDPKYQNSSITESGPNANISKVVENNDKAEEVKTQKEHELKEVNPIDAEIQTKINEIIKFANSNSFNTEDCNSHLTYLVNNKENIINYDFEQLKFQNRDVVGSFETLENRLNDMKDLGKNMWNFDNYNENKAEPRTTYLKNVNDIYHRSKLSEKQNTHIEEWLKDKIK